MATNLPVRKNSNQATPRLGSQGPSQTERYEDKCTALVHVPDVEDENEEPVKTSQNQINEDQVNSGVRRFLYELLEN